jgi:C-terminal processing protease CtpA/Prc
MCNRLLAALPEQEGGNRSYSDDMDAVFGKMKNNDVDELIIDLRLCNDGDLEMACKLASYVLPTDFFGGTFARTIWNDNKKELNKDIVYEEQIFRNGLHFDRVFVITSSYTQGAAEWFIHGLRTTVGADNVVLIGTPTAGQNVMCTPIETEYAFTLYPATNYVANSKGDYDYAKGLAPDMLVKEQEYVDLYPYGDLNEILLNSTIDVILSLQ